MIKITIETNNEAFKKNFGGEVSRILKEIARDFEITGGSRVKYQDINGNTVAYCK